MQITYIPIEVSGGVTGAACVLRDMTERNRMAWASGCGIGTWEQTPWSGPRRPAASGDSREAYFQAVWKRQRSGFTRTNPQKVEYAIQDVLAGRKVQYATQYRVVRPDGSTCWIDARGVVMPDRSGHMVGIGVDITDLKNVEESLRESEEKYLLLLNSTAEAIYGIDMNGDCTFCNPTCLRLLGYTKSKDILGKNMHALVHHSHADGSLYPNEQCQIYVAIRKGEGTHVADEVMWRHDGTKLPRRILVLSHEQGRRARRCCRHIS